MTSFLFVSLPFSGHTDWGGMLLTAAELRRRGHDVTWASEPAIGPAIQRAGLRFQPLASSGCRLDPPLPSGLTAEERLHLRQQRALDFWLHPQAVQQAVAELLALVQDRPPRLMVAEPYGAAAALVAEAAELPLVLCGRPALAGDPTGPAHPAGQRVQQLCRIVGLSGRYWDLARGQIRSPLLHIDFFSRNWYGDLAEIGSQTRFVGGLGRQARPAPGQRPIVLITLGSLFRDDPAFFRIASEAVMLEGGQPLVVTGAGKSPAGAASQRSRPQLRLDLPHGVELRDWVDFDEILPRIAAIIHHGGVGTTHAALRYGLPQLAVPHAGDQQPQAGRITQAKVGFGVRPADFSLANARWLVRQLIIDRGIRNSARDWRVELAVLGGVAKAADLLEE